MKKLTLFFYYAKCDTNVYILWHELYEIVFIQWFHLPYNCFVFTILWKLTQLIFFVMFYSLQILDYFFISYICLLWKHYFFSLNLAKNNCNVSVLGLRTIFLLASFFFTYFCLIFHWWPFSPGCSLFICQFIWQRHWQPVVVFDLINFSCS